jgi:hypothetical protein
MKAESILTMKVHRNRGRFLEGFAGLAAAATFLLIPAAANAANPVASGPVGKNPVVTIEKIPGKAAPRVILSAKAAERLGIETGKVGEELVAHKQMVSGLVIPPMDKQQILEAQPPPMLARFGFGDSGKGAAAPAPGSVTPRPKSPEAGDLWVLVTLSPGEWEKLAKDKSVRLLPLATRDKFQREVLAQPSGMAPVEDMKRSMLSLYYVVSGKDHGLTVNHRVRVELKAAGSAEKRKVVPYSTVYYDAQGAAWVYVNTQPLTYERQRIDVERIVGDLAVLSDGPPVGTQVVTVGAPLLHGAEIFKR